MYKIIKISVKWGLPLLLIGLILGIRYHPAWAEAYARHIYPAVAGILSAFSSLFPFSVGDVFIVGACGWLFIYPFYAWWKKKGFRHAVGKIVRVVMWIYVWFYFAWGLHYFRPSFYVRTGMEQTAFSESEFREFLEDYVAELRGSYEAVRDSIADDNLLHPLAGTDDGARLLTAGIVNEGYREIAAQFALVYSRDDLYPKTMLWSRFMSAVGVSGYMGPFFSEFNLNGHLLRVEYPFTFAHELAHRLGVASEAEANLYAFLVTAKAREPWVRFSGYFSMLGYVMQNARRLLDETSYRECLNCMPPEVLEIYKQRLTYWRGKYKPVAGKVQHKMYNAYLKNNKIGEGTKNYSEVVGLWMTLRKYKPDL